MKQWAEWYDTCLAVTHVSAANIYWCWWAPLHSGSPAQLFWSLVLLFLSPFFPVFCLLATSHQSSAMEAGPSSTSLLSIRSRDKMKVIMGTRQPGGHLTSQVKGYRGRADMASKYISAPVVKLSDRKLAPCFFLLQWVFNWLCSVYIDFSLW